MISRVPPDDYQVIEQGVEQGVELDQLLGPGLLLATAKGKVAVSDSLGSFRQKAAGRLCYGITTVIWQDRLCSSCAACDRSPLRDPFVSWLSGNYGHGGGAGRR